MDSHQSSGSRSIVDKYFSRMYRLSAGDAFLLKLTLLVCAAFLIMFLITVSATHTVQISAQGGLYTEGVVGTPRFVNPVLAVTRADKDLSALIYDGLMTLGENGQLIPNIADSVTISEDGLIYNVVLKQSVFFHDGTPLTARDVAFTVSRIQDPLLASPLRANFDGVAVEEVGTHEINFVLPEAYAPFMENLTFGILPEHVWKDASVEEFPFSQHNSEPVGAGPYAISRIARDASGIPEKYVLEAHDAYHADTPRISVIEMDFFPTEEQLVSAFQSGTIEGVAGVSPDALDAYEHVEEKSHLERIPLPRTFGIFFNQNKNTALRDDAVRTALNIAIDKQGLVDTILRGYGNVLTSPVPPGFGVATQADDTERGVEAAREALRNGGWEFDEESNLWTKEIDEVDTTLSFSIATVNNSAFEATAEYVRAAWEQLGVPVTIKQYEQTDLTQAVIRPRDYEALLFGTQLGRPLDYYSFWHSSQRNDPGLNIALYANITTDAVLAKIRQSTDNAERVEAIEQFVVEVATENPAIFLYAPELLYVFPDKVQNAKFAGVSEPHERFMRVHEWYIETESIWPFFIKK